MKTSKLTYFDQEDILHLLLADGEEDNSVELSPTITAELNAQGEVIGIEVLQASAFVREVLQELANARQLKLSPAGNSGAFRPPADPAPGTPGG
jgi:uncharacterized protein YuzE